MTARWHKTCQTPKTNNKVNNPLFLFFFFDGERWRKISVVNDRKHLFSVFTCRLLPKAAADEKSILINKLRSSSRLVQFGEKGKIFVSYYFKPSSTCSKITQLLISYRRSKRRKGMKDLQRFTSCIRLFLSFFLSPLSLWWNMVVGTVCGSSRELLKTPRLCTRNGNWLVLLL